MQILDRDGRASRGEGVALAIGAVLAVALTFLTCMSIGRTIGHGLPATTASGIQAQ